MSEGGARAAVVLAAVIVAALYGYRHVVSEDNHLIAGRGPEVSPEGFLIAWGLLFLILAVGATISPGTAGAFAILILIGDVFANFGQVAEGTARLEVEKGAKGAGAGILTFPAPASSAGPAPPTTKARPGPLSSLPQATGFTSTLAPAPGLAAALGLLHHNTKGR
jgi:hypothetical protein